MRIRFSRYSRSSYSRRWCICRYYCACPGSLNLILISKIGIGSCIYFCPCSNLYLFTDRYWAALNGFAFSYALCSKLCSSFIFKIVILLCYSWIFLCKLRLIDIFYSGISRTRNLRVDGIVNWSRIGYIVWIYIIRQCWNIYISWRNSWRRSIGRYRLCCIC